MKNKERKNIKKANNKGSNGPEESERGLERY